MATNASGGEPVLELRIHGVNNMPPHELLDLPPDEVEFAMGDKLGSFWHPTAESLDKGRAQQELGEGSRGVVDAVESPRGSVPDGIHREAYSWGGMVRTVPAGDRRRRCVIAAIGRACWTAVLPFSIANAAIWSWNLPRSGTRIRFQSGLIRVFCVVLTTLLILSFASIALDLIAVQCYGGRRLTCTALPEQFEVFARWSTGRRIAFFSIVPVAVLFAVFATSTLARLRYNVAGRIIKGKPATEEPVLLAQPQFWQSRTEISRLTSMHLATGIAMTALLCGLALASGSQPGVGHRRLHRRRRRDGDGRRARLPHRHHAVRAARGAQLRSRRSRSRRPSSCSPSRRARSRSFPGMDINGYAMRIAFNWVLVSTRARGGAAGDGDPVLPGAGPQAPGLGRDGTGRLHDDGPGDRAGPLERRERGRRRLAERRQAAERPRRRSQARRRVRLLHGDRLRARRSVAPARRLLPLVPRRAAGLPHRRPAHRGDRPHPATRRRCRASTPSGTTAYEGAARGRRQPARATCARCWPARWGASARAAARYHLVEPILGALCLAGMAATVVTVITAFSSLDQRFVKELLAPEPFATASILAARWMDFSLIVWGAVGLAVVGGLVFGGSKVVRPLGLVWDLACFLPTGRASARRALLHRASGSRGGTPTQLVARPAAGRRVRSARRS